jgi:hypothetical protein
MLIWMYYEWNGGTIRAIFDGWEDGKMVCSVCSITGLDLTLRDGYQDLAKGAMIMRNPSYYQMICKAF